MDELSIIDRYFRPLAGEGGFGLLDDAAALRVPAEAELVVTADMIAERVHFLPDDPPDTIARKALRVNLSDLAAKGATPLAYTLSLGLHADVDETWIAAFAAGLRDDQARFGIDLIGGDTISVGGGLVVSIAAFGLAPKGRMVHRFGAMPGDLLYVSGEIGAARIGLALRGGEAGAWDRLPAEAKARFVERYRVPVPRTALAAPLSALASAAMDISDGLVGDCDKLASASRCRATIEADRVPLPVEFDEIGSDNVRALLLTGGDDYEILAAVPPDRASEFEGAARTAGVPATQIGALAAGSGPTEVRAGGRPLALRARAYVHRRSTA